MNTQYKNRTVKSPYQPAIKPTQDVFAVTTANHPVRELINQSSRSHNLVVTFEEDKETIQKLKSDAVVAFICTLKGSSGRVLGVGRGHTVLSPQNKYIEKIIFTALNYSLIDCISKTTRSLNTLYTEANIPLQDEVPVVGRGYTMKDKNTEEMITDKQRSYLLELINVNVGDNEERERWSSNICEFTKEEASEAIQSFKN